MKIAYAYQYPDPEILSQSSSGGFFTRIAGAVLERGGVVFGARWDEDWKVVVDYSESIEGLAAFRGSKYVQARVGNAYRDCETFLKEGRLVLFSGTPCMISGLKTFLKHKYSNFYEHPYMQVFLSNIALRDSCYSCRYKEWKSGSDVTIGDFWGIDKICPEIDDDRGMSLVVPHNDRIWNWFRN